MGYGLSSWAGVTAAERNTARAPRTTAVATLPPRLEPAHSLTNLNIALERREPAGAVAEFFGRHAQILEDRHMKVRERRPFRMSHVPAAFDPRVLAADECDRQVVVKVRVAVADAGAVQEQRVVQHLPLTLRKRAQLLDEVGKLLHVELVNLVQPLELRRLVLMV